MRKKPDIDKLVKGLKDIAEKINNNCPVCKGETGRKCSICDGTGQTKIRPLKN